MLKKPAGRRLISAIGPLLPVIVGVLLLQVLFGGPLRAPKTEMTYTEFKAALRAGQIQTATVGVDQISGALAADEATDASQAADAVKSADTTEAADAPQYYHTVRVDDPDLLKDLEASKVNATGQVASNGGILAALGWVLPLVLFGVFGYFVFKSMRGAAGGAGGPGGIFSFGKSKARSSRRADGRYLRECGWGWRGRG